jgi:hypothetical protein
MSVTPLPECAFWSGFPEASYQRNSCPAGRNHCRVNRRPAQILLIVRQLANSEGARIVQRL